LIGKELQMKKLLTFIMLGFSTFFLLGCVNVQTTESKVDYQYSDYSFYQVQTFSDQLNYMDGEYYIYYYSEQCPACILIKDDVLSTISSLNEDTLLLFDVRRSISVEPSFNLEFTPSLVLVRNNAYVEKYVGDDEILPVLDSLQ